MKKVVSICVVIMTLISSMFVFADNQSTAEILSEMNLISGDDEGFNLDKQLTRSEASTFIVKLLGEEADVKERKAMYIKSNFEDIKGDEWYAMYIGYCERHGILTGYPDGTVKASEALNEKAFLTMVLKALGYEDQFTWDNVYEYSKEIGLVDSVEENTNILTRGDAVDIMYRALKTPKLDKGYLTENLLENEIVTKEVLEKHQLLHEVEVEDNQIAETTQPTSKLSIENIESKSGREIIIVFSTAVKSLSKEDIVIHKKIDSSDQVEILSCEIDKDRVIIKTKDQWSQTLYQLKINQVKDIYDRVESDLSYVYVSAVSDVEPVDMSDITDNDTIKIVDIISKENDTVEITFDKYIESISKEDLIIRQHSADPHMPEILSCEIKNNKVIVKTNEQLDVTLYEVIINKVIDASGNIGEDLREHYISKRKN